MSIRFVALVTLAGASLVACQAERDLEMNGQYWQRRDASSAIWMQGPKAQQTLNRDIARCVVEVRELARLGAIKDATPREKDLGAAPANGGPEYALSDYDTPERDGFLINEPQNYDDFETCMLAKGWERAEYLPHELAKTARETYRDTNVNLKARTQAGEVTETPTKSEPYGGLNP